MPVSSRSDGGERRECYYMATTAPSAPIIRGSLATTVEDILEKKEVFLSYVKYHKKHTWIIFLIYLKTSCES